MDSLHRRARRALHVGAGLLLVAGLLAGCRYHKPPPRGPAPGDLKLEQPYTGQELGTGGTAKYHFYAAQRGAYLIVVYGNPNPLAITLRHPKKTCHLRGNGSCELVSGPDESYTFEVSGGAGAQPAALRALRYTLLVTHSDGTGRYEGQVGDPVPLRTGQAHQGSVGVLESSYYSFVPGRAGPHTIALTRTASDLVWRLFDAPDFDVILQECDTARGAADEICQSVPLHAGVRYYVKVEDLSGVPGTYRLRVSGPAGRAQSGQLSLPKP